MKTHTQHNVWNRATVTTTIIDYEDGGKPVIVARAVTSKGPIDFVLLPKAGNKIRMMACGRTMRVGLPVPSVAKIAEDLSLSFEDAALAYALLTGQVWR